MLLPRCGSRTGQSDPCDDDAHTRDHSQEDHEPTERCSHLRSSRVPPQTPPGMCSRAEVMRVAALADHLRALRFEQPETFGRARRSCTAPHWCEGRRTRRVRRQHPEHEESGQPAPTRSILTELLRARLVAGGAVVGGRTCEKALLLRETELCRRSSCNTPEGHSVGESSSSSLPEGLCWWAWGGQPCRCQAAVGPRRPGS